MERSPGVWRLRVYGGKDPITGRPRQVSKTVRARTRTLALKELHAFAAEIEAQEVIPARVTVKDLLERWVTEFLPGEGKAKSTVDSYRLIVGKHLVPALGHVELSKLGAFHLDRYYRAQQAKGMADRTVRQHHAILSSALSQAVRWDWIARSPAVRAKPPKVPRGQGAIPTVEEVRALIRATAGDIDLAAAVALAAITGCRRGELCGLRWSDVDWEAGTVRVERQRLGVSGGYETLPLKHGDGRTVGVGPLGVAVLEGYRREVDARCARLRARRMDDGWLLSADGGRTPMGPKRLSEEVAALGRRAGVVVTPHGLRRFAATQLIGQGVDVRTAATRLGHNAEVMLRRYVGFIPANDQVAAELLSAAIGSPELVLPPVAGGV